MDFSGFLKLRVVIDRRDLLMVYGVEIACGCLGEKAGGTRWSGVQYGYCSLAQLQVTVLQATEPMPPRKKGASGINVRGPHSVESIYDSEEKAILLWDRGKWYNTFFVRERHSAHLCMRFSITVRMENGHGAFYSYSTAALVAVGSSPLDGKTQTCLGGQHQLWTVQQEKGRGPL